MSEFWITKEDEETKRQLEQLEGLVKAADDDAATHRDVAKWGAYITGLMAALIGTAEYSTRKWGIEQNVESAVGAFTLGITVLETSLVRLNKKRAAEAWQNAAHFMIQNESEQPPLY